MLNGQYLMVNVYSYQLSTVDKNKKTIYFVLFLAFLDRHFIFSSTKILYFYFDLLITST